MPSLCWLLCSALAAPTAIVEPGLLSAWDSHRDAPRLDREFIRYETSRGLDPAQGPTVDWSFALREGAFADLFLNRPIAEPFGRLRLVLRNEGDPLTLTVKLGDNSDSEWAGPRVALAGGGDWQTVDLPLTAFEVATWNTDRDGQLTFPARYLAVIAFDVAPGHDYRLRVAKVEALPPDPVPVQLKATGLPGQPRPGQAVHAEFELTMQRDWPAETGPQTPALSLNLPSMRPLVMPIAWQTPPAQWRPGQTVRGTAEFEVSRWLTGDGEWRLLAPGLDMGADNRLGSVKLTAPRSGGLLAEVRPYRGTPTLFINGQPNGAMAYAAYGPTPQVFREFGAAGVPLYSVCGTPTASGYGLSRDAAVAPDQWDFGELDERIRMVLDACPDAYLFPRIYLSAPDWWLDAHPEAVVTYDPGDGQPVPFIQAGRRVPSWASPAWREFVDQSLEMLVFFADQQPYADRILGWHLSSGTTEEWMMWGANDDAWTDYSPAGEAAWRAWRTAHGRPAVPVPSRAQRAASAAGTLRDPASDQVAIDYPLFLADNAVETMEHFAATVKKATQRKRLVGVFYGYLLQLFGQRQQNAAHLALGRLLRCPDIDFMCSPTSYAFRNLGTGTSHFMAPTDSVALHGKLWFDENDIRTSLAPGAVGEWGRQATIAGDMLQQNRELANVIAHGVGQWWFDVGRNRYDDPQLMAHVGQLRAVGEHALAYDRAPVDQVAMVSDGRGLARVQVGDMLTHYLMLEQIPPLSRIGAPVGYYELSDLPSLKRQRLIVFAPLYDPSPAERAALEGLKSDGRVLVFLHAPAPYRDGTWQPEHMTEACGLKLRSEDRTVEARIAYQPGLPLTDGLADGGFGPGVPLRPTIVGADPAATVLGTLPDGSPGLLMRRFDDWTAVWSAAPTLPRDLLVRLADLAGVHRYVQTDDVVWARKGLLALTGAAAGPREVTLPRPARVRDLYADRAVQIDGQRLTIDLPQDGTVLLGLE